MDTLLNLDRPQSGIYLSTEGGGIYLSAIVQGGWRHYGFHSLRHFMASHLADKERTGMKVISGLLRHKNLKTTEIYLHSIDESQRKAIIEIVSNEE